MYYLVYRHESGWSNVKIRDIHEVEDAVHSSATIEVWIRKSTWRDIDARMYVLWRKLMRCVDIGVKCSEIERELRELSEARERAREEERRMLESLRRAMSQCQDDECVRRALREHGFEKVK